MVCLFLTAILLPVGDPSPCAVRLAADTTLADSTGANFRCSAGLEHVVIRTSPERARHAYYPQTEEFCRQRLADGSVVLQGHYVLWGPNGERLEEGDYLDGKRDGVWRRWLPTQVIEDTWKMGKLSSVRDMGAPPAWDVDFCNCIPQAYLFYHGQGSMSAYLTGARGDTCWLATQIEIERGHGPMHRYRVPRGIGRLSFPIAPHMPPDLSALRAYQILDSILTPGRGPRQPAYR